MIAIETGFVQRSSKISGSDFLRMALFDHLQYARPSLQQHAFNLCQENGKYVSKQALDKRFNERSLAFIQKLFEIFLNRQICFSHLPSQLSQYFTSVKVMDSTEFKLPDAFAADFPGYSSRSSLACAAVQLEYDVLSKKIHCLSLGNSRQSDKTFADQRMDQINKGELILRDLGYYVTDSYLKIEQQEGFYVSRLKAQVSIYQKRRGNYEQLSWSSIMQKLKKAGTGFFDQWVYIGKQQKHPVRLMAWLLPKEEQQKRLQRKKSKKSTIGQQDIIWSKLNVFITNIPADIIDAQQAYNLYKIRWQIECMFKIWKSILNIDVACKMKTTRLKCYLYSKLIWVLLCWEITSIAELSNWNQNSVLISPYKCLAILKVKAAELKEVLFNNRRCLRRWLASIIELLLTYCNKESKKGRIQLSELLYLKNK